MSCGIPNIEPFEIILNHNIFRSYKIKFFCRNVLQNKKKSKIISFLATEKKSETNF